MRAVLFALGLLVPGACSAAPDAASPIPGVAVEGRYLLDEGDVVFGFPGAKLVTNATAPVTFDVTSEGEFVRIDSRVDDGPWDVTYLAPGDHSVTLGPDRPHRLSVVRRNEDWQGRLRVRGVSSDGKLRAAALPERKLLFIGDSITAGAGTDVAVEDRGEGKPLDNARLSFARVLGHRLDAQVHQIAFGGRGVVRDWEGKTDTLTAPEYYRLAVPNQNRDAWVRWDAIQWVPDAVIIGLGTNDFNPGVPDRDSWVDAYADFVANIREDAPDAPILLLNSPMTGGEKGDALEAYVDAVAAASGPNVHRANTKQYIGRPSVVGHPTDAQHELIANELEPVLRALLD